MEKQNSQHFSFTNDKNCKNRTPFSFSHDLIQKKCCLFILGKLKKGIAQIKYIYIYFCYPLSNYLQSPISSHFISKFLQAIRYKKQENH